MDLILQATDVVNVMFNEIKEGEEPDPADQGLLDSLEKVVNGQSVFSAPIENESQSDIQDTEKQPQENSEAPKENVAEEKENINQSEIKAEQEINSIENSKENETKIV